MEIIIKCINNSSFSSELYLLIIGAIIGFFASIGTIIIERFFDKKGKLNIFYKRTYMYGSNGSPGEITNTNCPGYYNCSIPLYLEIQNTSNSTRVIRDFCLLTYKNGKQIDRTYQVTHLHTTNRKGGKIVNEENIEFGSEKNSYSFVIPPRSIQRQNCWFEYKYSANSKDKDFDEIKIRYFDEKNKEKIYNFQKINDCKSNQEFVIDKEWILVK